MKLKPKDDWLFYTSAGPNAKWIGIGMHPSVQLIRNNAVNYQSGTWNSNAFAYLNVVVGDTLTPSGLNVFLP